MLWNFSSVTVVISASDRLGDSLSGCSCSMAVRYAYLFPAHWRWWVVGRFITVKDNKTGSPRSLKNGGMVWVLLLEERGVCEGR
jgi:hypothetical protein